MPPLHSACDCDTYSRLGAVLTAGSDSVICLLCLCSSQVSVLSCVFFCLSPYVHLGLVDHVPSGCVAKINIPWPWPWPWHPLSYKLYIHTYMHKCMLACMNAYILTFVCIHSYALSLNHTPCFSVYLPVPYTQAILWVLELDTFCWYFTGRRPYFVTKTNLSRSMCVCCSHIEKPNA